MIRSPYEVLGISKGASSDEIKSAYRKKAKEYHPDLHPGDPKAEEKFKEVNMAYEMINNPSKYSAEWAEAEGRAPGGYGGQGYGGSSFRWNPYTGESTGSSGYGSGYGSSGSSEDDRNGYRSGFYSTPFGFGFYRTYSGEENRSQQDQSSQDYRQSSSEDNYYRESRRSTPHMGFGLGTVGRFFIGIWIFRMILRLLFGGMGRFY